MDCKKCKKSLAQFLDEQLAKSQQRSMEKHLKSCPKCADNLKSLQKMISIMRTMNSEKSPE
ncbi:MAG: zf-HC2 domain-containing protein [Candidatus Omnitrophota bacterium]